MLKAMGRDAGPMVLARVHAVMRLCAESDLIAELVLRVNRQYELFLHFRDPVSRQYALEGVELLIGEVRSFKLLSVEEKTEAMRRLAGIRRKLREGLEADEAAASAILDRRALARRRAADRAAHRVREDRATAIHASIEDAWAELPQMPADARRAFEMFLVDVPVADISTWAEISMKLAGFRKMIQKVRDFEALGGVVNPADPAFRKLLRPEASSLKGFLLERSFWMGKDWEDLAVELMTKARQRSRRLFGSSNDAEAIMVTEPLRELRTGAEIYDGAIMLARPTDDPRVIEGVLDATVNMKAERDVTVLQQIERELRRESGRGSSFSVRLSSQRGQTFVISPAPDQLDMTRIFVAPQLPGGSAVASMPTTVKARFLPALLDAEQFDLIAYALLVHPARIPIP